MVEPGGRPPLSLSQEQRLLTESRIREAAVKVVARRGFDATIEEIAQESGVSPRTIFRHYECRDRLILGAVKDMFEKCGKRPIEGLPSPDDDLDAWIDGLAHTVHARNAEVLGEAFWDIHAPSHNTSQVLHEVNDLRREFRIRGINHLVSLAWQKAGGAGEPPCDLVLAFALNFSAYATQALMVDFDRTPSQIGDLTAKILKVLVCRAVQGQDVQTSESSCVVADSSDGDS